MNFSQLYDQIKNGELSHDEARQRFSLDYLKTANNYIVDINRDTRNGIPEIIYGEYKLYEQIIEIAETILSKTSQVIISRFQDNKKLEQYFSASYKVYFHERICIIGELPKPKNHVLVVSGGCADHPVACEVSLALQAFGINSLLYEDRGVAHPTRVIEALTAGIEKDVKAVIVIAGMEASLATFVSSLIALPIIGVPTSIGYGYKAKESALISMLSSCSPNLAVVNIDGGVRAAVVASLIARG